MGLPVISNVHYIVATPTTDDSMPTAGTASYNLVGGSVPISTTRGAGTLNSGTFTANFTNATVGTVLNLDFGNTTYTVGGTGQFRQPGYDAAIIVPGTGSNGAPIAAVINGVFSGADAHRASITCSVTGGLQTTGNINGAPVFQRVPQGKDASGGAFCRLPRPRWPRQVCIASSACSGMAAMRVLAPCRGPGSPSLRIRAGGRTVWR
ncbi:MAG TPA: hypothetical protein VMR43_00805 [Variovorax sp.]|nr:hypothetical protein [Variovorax sp.]